MKIVIDILEEIYTAICDNGYIFDEDSVDIAKAIKNGEPYNSVVDPCDMNMFEPDGATLGKGMLEE